MAPSTHTIGLIGLDTSHVVAFAGMLNDPDHAHHLPGGRVTAAWPGGSEDFELSASRVGGFTEQLSNDYGVEMLESPAAVAEAVDVVFITAVDGRVHRELFEQVAPAAKPVFIDKPFATTLGDAKAMVVTARDRGIALMSCSSLRYGEGFVQALSADSEPIVGCDVCGPMNLEPTQPGLLWYGIHSVEMVVAAMGVGCVQAAATTTDTAEGVLLTYADGRVATIHGLRSAHGIFGVTLHRAGGITQADARTGRPGYAAMLEAILATLPRGESDIPPDQMLEVMRIIDAANRSRDTGQPVDVDRSEA